MKDLEYDPMTRIKASECREKGIMVPDEIPDCAHVSRSSISPFGVGADGELLAAFDEPFEWVEVEAREETAEEHYHRLVTEDMPWWRRWLYMAWRSVNG
jgi:hypothetical protein